MTQFEKLEKNEKFCHSKGFTLSEVMVAMTISLLVLAPIISTQRSQQKSFRIQLQVVEIQQNIRAAMFYLERAIRSAGYDPFGTGSFGFVRKFSDDDKFEIGNDLAAMTIDMDENGELGDNYSEKVAYRLKDNALKYYKGKAGWQPVVNHIDALDFAYLDENGARLNPSAYPAEVAKIRSVQVTIVGRTRTCIIDHVDNKEYRNLQGEIIFARQNDNYIRRSLSAEIRCRNLGLF